MTYQDAKRRITCISFGQLSCTEILEKLDLFDRLGVLFWDLWGAPHFHIGQATRAVGAPSILRETKLTRKHRRLSLSTEPLTIFLA